MRRAFIFSVASMLLFSITWAAPAMAAPPLFDVPTDYPLNGADWTGTPDINASIANLTADSFDCTTTSVFYTACYFVLPFDAPQLVTSYSYTLTSSTGSLVHSVYLCPTTGHTSLYPSTLSDCNGFGFTGSGAGDVTDEIMGGAGIGVGMEIVIAIGNSGAGTASISNLVINGDVYGFRPVRDDDVATEVLADDTTSLIVTVAGAPLFAVADGSIGSVIHTATGYNVALSFLGNVVIYDNLASTFVEVGDTVEGGCVIGYAGEPPPNYPTQTSFAIYVHDPDLSDWHDYAESLSALPCNQTASSCINANPNMDNNGSGWSSRYALASHLNNADDSYMLLPMGGELYQRLPVIALEESYYVTVIVANATGRTVGELTAYVTDTASTQQVTTIGSEYVTLNFTPLSAGAGPSEFRIRNTFDASNTLKITFACLSLGEPLISPPECYFDNPELRVDDWETSAGVVHKPPEAFGPGIYVIPDGEWIRAPIDISAFADAETNFTLTLGGYKDITGTPTLEASVVDSDTDDLLQSIGSGDFPYLFNSTVDLPFSLEAAEHIVGDLLIENNSGSGEAAYVTFVCLRSDAGIFPGYENPDYATPGELLPTDCTACHTPASVTDVVAWLYWLGCLFRYLLYCLIYTLINNVWATITAIGAGLGLLGRWLGAAITVVATWAWQAALRLFSQFTSWLIPIVNAVLAWLFAQPFFRSLLDAFAIAGMWLDAMFAMLQTVFAVFGAALNLLAAIATLIGNVWTAFITAATDTSTANAAFINCADTGDPFYGLCLGMATVNFFVAKVIMLAVLTTVFAVIMGWRQLQAAFEEFEEAAVMLG